MSQTGFELSIVDCSYVLIHYVQTNVNYLPLKYPQKQVQRSMGGSHADPNTFNTLFFFFFFKDTFQEKTEYNDHELNS